MCCKKYRICLMIALGLAIFMGIMCCKHSEQQTTSTDSSFVKRAGDKINEGISKTGDYVCKAVHEVAEGAEQTVNRAENAMHHAVDRTEDILGANS